MELHVGDVFLRFYFAILCLAQASSVYSSVDYFILVAAYWGPYIFFAILCVLQIHYVYSSFGCFVTVVRASTIINQPYIRTHSVFVYSGDPLTSSVYTPS